MTLVTRSAVRLSRQGGRSLKNARANAAFFTTAANQAANLPAFRPQAPAMKAAAKPGKSCSYTAKLPGALRS